MRRASVLQTCIFHKRTKQSHEGVAAGQGPSMIPIPLSKPSFTCLNQAWLVVLSNQSPVELTGELGAAERAFKCILEIYSPVYKTQALPYLGVLFC